MLPVSRIGVMGLVLLAAAAMAQPAHEMPRPAYQAPLAAEALVLDVTATSRNLVAVGERGHVLLSQDGRSWIQADFVPVQATLTRVAYAEGHLWAVGHDSTIIHSYDFGQTWSVQHFEPDWEMPLLDVHFHTQERGLAVGAFGLFMETNDGGQRWDVFDLADRVTSEAIDWDEAALLMAMDDESTFEDLVDQWDDDEYYDAAMDFDRGCYEFMECHLNAFLELADGRQMIAAERGYGFRSVDGGETWESFRFPYSGSMFGLVEFAEDSILAFGLRGHVQRSDDFGDSWEILETGLQSTLKGAALDAQGRPLMVGSGAARLRYDPGADEFELNEDRLGSDYVSVLITSDGTVVLAGADGLSHE